nr:acyltransferase [Methanocella conradii]
MRNNYLSGDASVLLDLLRVLACEMVVVSHIIPLYLLYKNVKYDNSLIWMGPGNLGIMGVMLFFFISGIVISNSLFKKLQAGNYGFGSYFIDRFSRIYSGLVPCLIIILALDILIRAINAPLFYLLSPRFGTSSISIDIFLANLLMLQMMPPFHIPRPPFAELLWTLNIEWWLYMAFGWLIVFYKPKNMLKVKAMLGFLLFSLYPIYLAATNYRGTLVPVWFFGVLITAMMTRGIYAEQIRKYFKYLFPIAIILIAIRMSIDLHIGIIYYEYVLELLAGCAILLAVINFNGKEEIFRGARLKGFIKTMASYSYTLYLLHVAMIAALLALDDIYGLSCPLPAFIAISLVLTNVVAYIVAYFTEMRYRRLAKWIKDKAEKARLRLLAPARPSV